MNWNFDFINLTFRDRKNEGFMIYEEQYFIIHEEDKSFLKNY
ncbi:hypothetical protein [Flavobacterium sp. 7A]|nr:hypothetical protein [Flavobacterium sp. 7A]MCW2118264.1 hypothetical protein [Flavobacterium sp. 7A]